jgi:hypothetical protein
MMGLVGFLDKHMAHFSVGLGWVGWMDGLGSIPAHWQKISILFICGGMCFMSLVIIARSFAYAAELSVCCDVLSL